MANSAKLAETVVMLVERDEEFRPFMETALAAPEGGKEPFWSLKEFKSLLGYEENESIKKGLDRAKIAAEKVGLRLKDHFKKTELFGGDEDILVSRFAAKLIAINADPNKKAVAIAQAYFAVVTDDSIVEDEKRLRARLDITAENKKLSGVAEEKGVQDHGRFQGVGISALYGGLTVTNIKIIKGLKKNDQHLDFAGSEELAANLFRITQTSAALNRQEVASEDDACSTHRRVALGVRKTILGAGNLPPEKLPIASKIDKLATKTRKRVKAG